MKSSRSVDLSSVLNSLYVNAQNDNRDLYEKKVISYTRMKVPAALWLQLEVYSA
jgi:hypothetical protein